MFMLFSCLWPKWLAGRALFWISFSPFNIFWLQCFWKHLKSSLLIENHWMTLPYNLFPQNQGQRKAAKPSVRQSRRRGGNQLFASKQATVITSFFSISWKKTDSLSFSADMKSLNNLRNFRTWTWVSNQSVITENFFSKSKKYLQ